MSKNEKDKKSRLFAIVTYAVHDSEIIATLTNKLNSVRGYAVSPIHDRDLKEDGITLKDKHYHILLRTYNAFTCVQISNWFKGLKDYKDEDATTLTQFCKDANDYYGYLTHKNDSAKVQYNTSDIIHMGVEELLSEEKQEAFDDSYEIINKIIEKKTSTREMVKTYGRDFIYHFDAYYKIAGIIRSEEEEKNYVRD